jgi:hypothetical protein
MLADALPKDWFPARINQTVCSDAGYPGPYGSGFLFSPSISPNSPRWSPPYQMLYLEYIKCFIYPDLLGHLGRGGV